MKGSIHYKLRQLLAALLMGLVGPAILLLLFNHPASLGMGTILIGWGVAALFVWFSWRRRSALWPWRYAVSVAALLALIMQISLSLILPLPEAHAAGIEVTTVDDEFNSGGACSLREAIQAANTNSSFGGCIYSGGGADIITFHPISAAGTIVFTQMGASENNNATGDLDITQGVQIDGLGIGTTRINAAGLDRVFHIRAGSGTIRFSDLRIEGGISDGDGGGIFNQNGATVVLDNVIVENNDVTGLGEDGGGIANTGGGTVNITNDSVINNNEVTNTGTSTDTNIANGGGIFNSGSGSTVNISDSSITSNEAVDDGGGVYNFAGATANITQTLIAGNMATNNGGGLLNLTDSTLNVTESTISGNTAMDGGGGGLFNELGIVTITEQTRIFDNDAQTSGGGVFNSAGGQLTIENSEIVENDAQTLRGGGVANERGTVTLNNTLVSGNTTSGDGDSDGGGIANLRPGATLTINNSTIIGNEANDDGGGVSNAFTGVLTINTSVISDNLAADNGGGLFNTDLSGSSSTVTITQSTIQDNSAPSGQGGGLFSDGIVVVEISTVSGNTASEGGGIAANFDGAQIELNGVTIVDNEATTQGGGIFRGTDDGGGSITFVNSLIAENTGLDPDCSDQGGSPSPATLTSQGHNLIGNPTGCKGLIASDLIGADPKLGPLADNGFSTQTHALLAGSEAIDAGDDTACTSTDQRQEDRADQAGVGTALCDIGAFEFTPVDVPALAINDVTLDEGDSGSQVMTFEVTLTGSQPFTATVDYGITAAGTATEGEDYDDTSGTLTFDPAVQSQTIEVTINGDSAPEPDETFTVNLSNATWATISDAQGVGTITNDDTGISISDSEGVEEGDEGLTDVTLDVTLSLTSDTTVTVDYNTVDGTAVEDVDYAGSSGTVMFTSGITQQQITVQVIGDTVPDEGDEIFRVNLSNPTGGASIEDGLGQVTILEDDFTNFFIFLPTIMK